MLSLPTRSRVLLLSQNTRRKLFLNTPTRRLNSTSSTSPPKAKGTGTPHSHSAHTSSPAPSRRPSRLAKYARRTGYVVAGLGTAYVVDKTYNASAIFRNL